MTAVLDDAPEVPVGCVCVRAIDLAAAADEIIDLAVSGDCSLDVTPNIQHVSLLEQGGEFAEAYACTQY